MKRVKTGPWVAGILITLGMGLVMSSCVAGGQISKTPAPTKTPSKPKEPEKPKCVDFSLELPIELFGIKFNPKITRQRCTDKPEPEKLDPVVVTVDNLTTNDGCLSHQGLTIKGGPLSGVIAEVKGEKGSIKVDLFKDQGTERVGHPRTALDGSAKGGCQKSNLYGYDFNKQIGKITQVDVIATVAGTSVTTRIF